MSTLFSKLQSADCCWPTWRGTQSYVMHMPPANKLCSCMRFAPVAKRVASTFPIVHRWTFLRLVHRRCLAVHPVSINRYRRRSLFLSCLEQACSRSLQHQRVWLKHLEEISIRHCRGGLAFDIGILKGWPPFQLPSLVGRDVGLIENKRQ